MTTTNFNSVIHTPVKNVLFVIQGNDPVFLSRINQNMFANVYVRNREFITWTEVLLHARKLGCTAIATTRFPFFIKDLEGTHDANIGSLHVRDGMRVLFLPELYRTASDTTMEFMVNHWLRKLAQPHLFLQPDPFGYEVITLPDLPKVLPLFDTALLCAVDIETVPEFIAITSISWTILLPNMRTRTFVADFVSRTPLRYAADGSEVYAFMDGFKVAATLNAHKVPKVTQNGMYDSLYFIRFGIPMTNWLYDTYHMQHCMFCECPKDLGFLAQMYLLKVSYWKDMITDARLEYNGRDTHNTLWIFASMLLNAKALGVNWHIRNYAIEFKLVFPCLHCDIEGIAVDSKVRDKLAEDWTREAEQELAELCYAIGIPDFNPGSPKQVQLLFDVLSNKTIKGTGKIQLAKLAELGPIQEWIASKIKKYRKLTKAVSNYFEFPLLDGRCLYHLDPGGTESGRFASKASSFWCGVQLQNIPNYAKVAFVSDEGYVFGAADGSQAESRCTAYLSQDANLMHTVETSPDFHRTNASLFFGMPFEEITKDIRELSKRTNHGANYNMGPWTLVNTMGTAAIFKARRLLDLPQNWDAMKIARYLLQECFCKAYPDLRNRWYPEIVYEVVTTGKLVGPTGWTRRTFKKPDKNKLDLNSLVAHGPQSLSVMQVNMAFFKVWRLQMTELAGVMRLKGQVHDEILFQYKEGRDDVPYIVSKVMSSTTVQVHGRTMLIPNSPKYGKKVWAEIKS